MTTCAEQLPIEIWLIIFRYLEAHDLFQSFDHLNIYFSQILASSYLSFYVRLKETDNNHVPYPGKPFWSDAVLDRITCLRSPVQSRSTYFLQFLHYHAHQLTRLQSLSIKISPLDIHYTPFVGQSLRVLDHLEYLNFVCSPDQNVLESILALRSLRICRLSIRNPLNTISQQFNVNYNIQQLFLIFINSVSDEFINLLLMHMPKLKRLEISGPYFSFSQASIFATQVFTLPELRIAKIKLANAHLSSDCFKYLHSIMPRLKHFYFNYEKYILPDTFLDLFVSNWWPNIEQIPYITIYINGRLFIDHTNNNTQLNLQKNQQILLARTSQFHGLVKVQWTEQNFTSLRSIEISIKKSL